MGIRVSVPPKGIYHVYPTLVAVVTAKLGDRMNVMSAAWHTALSFEPFLYGVAIAPSRFTHHMIEESGEFTINFLSFQDAHYITLFGRTSGRDIDKFKVYRVEIREPVKVQAPVLAVAYAAYECKVVQAVTTGDHTFFVGEVLAAHEREDGFDEKGLPILKVLDPALYLGRNRYLSIREAVPIKMDLEEARKKIESR